MDQQIIEMSGNAFAEWAERTYGADYDDVMFLDMARDLSGATRMPEGFEVSSDSNIPAALYDILMARKAHRDPAYVARDAERTEGEQEARALVQQAQPLSRETWKRLVELGYATRLIDTGSEQGYASVTYSLTERGEQLLNPSYRAPGLYSGMVE